MRALVYIYLLVCLYKRGNAHVEHQLHRHHVIRNAVHVSRRHLQFRGEFLQGIATAARGRGLNRPRLYVKAEPLAQTRLGGAHRRGETSQAGRYVPLNSFNGTVAWDVY